MQNIVSHFMRRLPDGLSCSDAEQLCLQLYCLYREQLTRQGLADIFAELSKAGWVRRGPSSCRENWFPEETDIILESSYWDGVISGFYINPDCMDIARGDKLLRQFGFEHEPPVA